MESCSPFISSGMCFVSFSVVWLFFTPVQWALSRFTRFPTRSHPHQCHSHSCSEDSSGCSCLKLQNGASDGQQPLPCPPQRSPRALVPCGLYPLECGLLLVTRRKDNGTPPPRLASFPLLPSLKPSHLLSCPVMRGSVMLEHLCDED